MNAESVVPEREPSRNGSYPVAGRRQGWGTATPSAMPPLVVPAGQATEASPSEVPLQDDVYSLLRERADVHAQIFDAAQIQRKLSGPRMLRSGSVQFASEVFAARFLSGDFTILSQDGTNVFTVLGDIAGKGIAAGMWFTHFAGLLQSYGRPDSDPYKIATEINRHLCYLRPFAPFVTAFFALTDCELGTLTYCNAGHFPPILLRADGRSRLLDEGGPLLGAIEGAEYQNGKLVLEPGDTLVAYSDGILECRNPAEEEFGMERLIATLRQAEEHSAHDMLMMLLAAVQDFANGRPLCDDLSLTVIQRGAKDADRPSSVKSGPWDCRRIFSRL